MWLKLDLKGMRIDLQIKRYQPFGGENWDCQWCDVDCSFDFPGCISYSMHDAEVLLSCEIDTLESKLDAFINDRIKEKEMLSFIEPDFEFDFFPSYNMVEAGELEYAPPGHEMSAAIVEWKVNLWSDRLTKNYFSTTLYKNDVRVLRDYLRLVIGKFDKNGTEIQEYFKAGLIGGQF